jgi:hypothetical protein
LQQGRYNRSLFPVSPSFRVKPCRGRAATIATSVPYTLVCEPVRNRTRKVWRWFTEAREPKWSDVFFQFGYIALVWEIASFVQSHWFGQRYSEIPYRIFFTGFALGIPFFLKINIGALRWLERRLL